MRRGAASHQMTRSPSKAYRTLIEVTMKLDMIKTMALIADFMVAGMGRRKRYSTISTSPVAFNSFHNASS